MPDDILCQDLLARKNSLSSSLDTFNEDLTLQWTVCVSTDTLPGGPAAGQDSQSVQLRIDELIPIAYNTQDPNHLQAIDAIVAYNEYLSIYNQRLQDQLSLNSVIQQLIANGCPLE